MLGDADIRCWFNAAPLLRHPLHREFLAFLGAVEKIKIEQLLVRKAGLIRQSFEIVQNVRTQVDSHGSARREERFLFGRSEEHTSELQSRLHLVCRLLLE